MLLQPSLLEELRKAAELEGVALNQLINVAVAEKISALRTGVVLPGKGSLGGLVSKSRRRVENAAERDGKSLAEWLRELALRSARERPADPIELLLAELMATRCALLNLFHATALVGKKIVGKGNKNKKEPDVAD